MEKSVILKELSNDEKYYGEYGKQFLSNSDIDTLINNPAGFMDTREDSINLMYGRAFHELVMFGTTQYDNYVEASTRNTKIYKEAEAENGLMFLKKEWDELNTLVQCAFKNKVFSETVKDASNNFEVPNVGSLIDDDIVWKCKADIVSSDCIIDIKTTSSIKGFKYSSKSWNYDSQAYIYSSLFQKPMKFLVIDKTTKVVGLMDVSDEAYDNGREKVSKAEDNYREYFVNKSKSVENFTIYGEI
jgi:hypothetical protein